jgi:hypothetical protein
LPLVVLFGEDGADEADHGSRSSDAQPQSPPPRAGSRHRRCARPCRAARFRSIVVSATVILLDPLVAVCVIEDVAVASSRPVTTTAPEHAARLLGSYTTRWDSKYPPATVGRPRS